MQFTAIIVAFMATAVFAVPAVDSNPHCDSGCSGVCSEGYCYVQDKYFFPCGTGSCTGHDGAVCKGFGNSPTQCPLS